jgi:CBS domain-containing protein
MSIHVSEPGRPIGTRLPERFRGRPVRDVSELSESAPIDTRHSDATDAEYQQAVHSVPERRKALEEYGAASADQPESERPYLPVSRICTPTVASLPASSTLQDAMDAMDHHGVHHLVITSEENVAGLVDLRWILAWLHENRVAPDQQSFAYIELPAFLTASPETDAHQLARLMLAHRLNAGLVVDEAGKAAGIVTSTDYLRIYAGARAQEGEV